MKLKTVFKRDDSEESYDIMDEVAPDMESINEEYRKQTNSFGD